MSLTRNLVDFTGLVAPATEPDIGSLTQEIIDIGFTVAVFDDGISFRKGSDQWVFEFSVDPVGAELVSFDAAVAAHTGQPYTTDSSRLTSSAEQVTASGSFVSVISPLFLPGPLAGGDWQFTFTSDINLDAASFSGSGASAYIRVAVFMDAGGIADFHWGFDEITPITYTTTLAFANGSAPEFDIQMLSVDSTNIRIKNIVLQMESVPTAIVEVQ